MIVLTTLLTSTPDPQRGTKWEPHAGLIEQLMVSVCGRGHQLVVLHDESLNWETDNETHVLIDRKHPNPYFDRWNAYASVLADWWATPRWDGIVWCVDAADVELLRHPELLGTGSLIEPRLYCGSEPGSLGDCGVGSSWLYGNHPLAHGVTAALSDRPLYNAGIVGGDFRAVAAFARSVARLANDLDLTDMAAFNLAMNTWHGDVVTGDPVHTEFRSEQRDHPTAWWRHK